MNESLRVIYFFLCAGFGIVKMGSLYMIENGFESYGLMGVGSFVMIGNSCVIA